MLTKTIRIDGKNVTFGASASVVRLYRARFGRDILKDIALLTKSLKEANINAGAAGEMSDEEKITVASALPVETLEMFENLAYVMAKAANPSIPNTPEEWLDEFSVFSIYALAPEIVHLWMKSSETISIPKKK